MMQHAFYSPKPHYHYKRERPFSVILQFNRRISRYADKDPLIKSKDDNRESMQFELTPPPSKATNELSKDNITVNKIMLFHPPPRPRPTNKLSWRFPPNKTKAYAPKSRPTLPALHRACVCEDIIQALLFDRYFPYNNAKEQT